MIPLLFVDSAKEKAQVDSEVRMMLKLYHHGQPDSAWLNPLNRMKPLDCAKVLMGI